MSAVDEIMQQIPLGQLASQLGTDEQTAGAAVEQAIPALLGGMHANAQDPAGAASLAGALNGHSANLIDGGVDLDQVDVADGQKIVSNVFGGQADGVAQTLGGLGSLGGGNQSDLMRRLLPILAPIVMSYLAKRLGGSGGTGGGLLGSILAGAGGAGGQSAGGGLGDVLGGLLGGSSGAPGQPGGLGDILGGLLGGGRR